MNYKKVLLQGSTTKAVEITMTHSNLRKKTTGSSAEQIFPTARGVAL